MRDCVLLWLDPCSTAMEGGKELWKKNRQEREIGENKEEREKKKRQVAMRHVIRYQFVKLNFAVFSIFLILFISSPFILFFPHKSFIFINVHMLTIYLIHC
jgi:hypothetical protein